MRKKKWLICMEHTGVYGQPLWKYLNEKAIEYCVVSGSVISSGLVIKRGKSDRLDAITIARFAKRFSDQLKPHKLPAQLLRRLKILFAYRDRLVKAKVLLQVPAGELKGYAKCDSEYMCEDTDEVVAYFKNKIKQVEKLMSQLIKSEQESYNCFN